MMISPEFFYEENLKGKSPEQIMSVIRSLKRKILKLKNIMEHPDYASREWAMHPGEDVQLSMNREYLQRAIQALEEAGGTYNPSAAEQRALKFENSIPYIKKVELCVGIHMGPYKTKAITIVDAKAYISKDLSLDATSTSSEIEMNKEEFFEELKYLHIGEWRKNYNASRFGIWVMDGTYWDLKIYFSNEHKPVKIHGDNAYPYNFNRLLELFEIEE